MPAWRATTHKSGTKVLLFFDMTKYFRKKNKKKIFFHNHRSKKSKKKVGNSQNGRKARGKQKKVTE